jgi:hypothetical protein
VGMILCEWLFLYTKELVEDAEVVVNKLEVVVGRF